MHQDGVLRCPPLGTSPFLPAPRHTIHALPQSDHRRCGDDASSPPVVVLAEEAEHPDGENREEEVYPTVALTHSQ